ncbi:MAG TPA: hypothetical protein VH249_26000, partial [Xanthobacteraceae bacterium]|nr:hypothetical protein [Xanthobacteraceae bacterium]
QAPLSTRPPTGRFHRPRVVHSKEDGRNAKRPRGFPAGAIPTVDFLLHFFCRFVKKTGVKILVAADVTRLVRFRKTSCAR